MVGLSFTSRRFLTHNLAVTYQIGVRSMPRRRRHDKHLPQGLYQVGKKYRRRIYVGPDRKPSWEYFDTLESALSVVAAQQPTGLLGKGIERYRREILPKKLSPETQRTEGPRLDRLKRVFGHMHPDAVTRQHVYAYLDRRPTVAGNREIARLGAVYRYLIRWGMAEENPCEKIERDKEPSRSHYVTDEDLGALLSLCLDRAFHGQPSAVMVYSVLRLEYLTGRRGSTILALRRDQLTDEGIAFEETKVSRRNNKGELVREPHKVIVAWSDELREAVAAIKRLNKAKVASLHLIPNARGGQASSTSYNRAWQAIRPWLADAGIAPLQPRDVRAKHQTDFAGADLGHSDPKVTLKHYQRKPKVIQPLR